MTRLLTIISLILALVLFPPAALAVISNNAVPGDSTYPIKRSLEDIIFAVASVNPVTKAWFAAARSDRRFTEFKALVAQGKKGAETLNELVEQTNIAASQIAQVTDPAEKAKLIEQLSANIDKYDQGLQQLTVSSSDLVSDNNSNPQPAVLPRASVIPSARTNTQPTPIQSGPTASPVVQPTPIESRPTAQPANQSSPRPSAPTIPTSTQTPTPIPTVQPTPAPGREDEDERQRQRELEEARRRLEEIRRGLGGESSHRDSPQSVQGNQDNRQKDDNKKDDHSDKSSDKSKEKGKSGKGK